jgi:hypothetical protein
MRMSVQVPRSMMGAIPDPHGIVTDHDGLAMYGDFRKVAEPRERLGQLANLFVVISRHRKDLLAANLLAALQRFRLAPDADPTNFSLRPGAAINSANAGAEATSGPRLKAASAF